MKEYTVIIENENAVTEIANRESMTVREWLQARVTELENNCVAQVKNIKGKAASEKAEIYVELPKEEQAKADKVYADYAATKVEVPVGEVIKP